MQTFTLLFYEYLITDIDQINWQRNTLLGLR